MAAPIYDHKKIDASRFASVALGVGTFDLQSITTGRDVSQETVR